MAVDNDNNLKFNDISKALKEEMNIKPLGRKEIASFELNDKYASTLTINGYDRKTFPRMINIPNPCVIFDPYWDNEGNEVSIQEAKKYPEKCVGKSVNLAYIPDGDGSQAKHFGEVSFRREDEGQKVVTSRVKRHDQLLQFLKLHNYNETNPKAEVPEEGFMFRESEPSKAARNKQKTRKRRMNMERLIEKMSSDDLTNKLNVLNLPISSDNEINRNTLYDYISDAEKDEKQFSKLQKFESLTADARTPILSAISRWEKEERIFFDENESKWKLNIGGKYDIGDSVPPEKNAKDYLVDYFYNNNRGKAWHDYLSNLDEEQKHKEAKEQASKEISSSGSSGNKNTTTSKK